MHIVNDSPEDPPDGMGPRTRIQLLQDLRFSALLLVDSPRRTGWQNSPLRRFSGFRLVERSRRNTRTHCCNDFRSDVHTLCTEKGLLPVATLLILSEDNKAMDQKTNTSVAEPDDNVVYSSLALQLDPFPANGDDVTYSTVVPKRRNQRNVQTKAEPDDNVVYSSLALHHTGAYRVSVKTGGSSTIPCPYHQEYKTHVKYLCKIDDLQRCSPVVHAEPPKSTDKASISDYINQLTVTVTMTDLEPEDSGRKSPATLTYDYMTGVLVSFTGITIIVQVDMRNVATHAPTTEQSSFSPTAESVQTDNTVQGPEGVKEKDTMSSVYPVSLWYTSPTQAPTTEQSSFSPTAEPVQTDNTVQGPEGGKEKDTIIWERTFFYMPKIGNAVLFLLCTIIAVVKFRAN
ncbi:unnamed protein product [Coregonus sp. 'balchen']|nr:unnamed protein product [Coregonus sp. 'balchen']